MGKDAIIGKVKEVSGEIRSGIAHATGDKKGEARGKIDQAMGKAQKNYGKITDVIKDSMND